MGSIFELGTIMILAYAAVKLMATNKELQMQLDIANARASRAGETLAKEVADARTERLGLLQQLIELGEQGHESTNELARAVRQLRGE